MPGKNQPTLDDNNISKIEELTNRVHELESAQRRYFYHSINLLCVTDGAYFGFLSESWEEALGYTLEELTAKPFMDFVYPPDVARTIDVYTRMDTEKLKVKNFFNRYVHKDGSLVTLCWNASPIIIKGEAHASARVIEDYDWGDE